MRRKVSGVLATLVGALSFISTVHAKDIVVGQATALTGALASSGVPMRLGAQVCFDAVNATGGINGHQIKFISKDDQYKVEETVRLVKEFVEKDDAVVLLGGSGTSNNEELLRQKILQNADIALVGPRTGATALRKPFNPYMFHVRASYAQEVEKGLNYYLTSGTKRIGIVYQDDGLGQDGLAAAQNFLANEKIEPAFTTTYERNSIKVEEAVKKALSSNAQAILLVMTSAPAAAFVKLYRESEGNAQLMTLSNVDADTVIKNAGLHNAHGLAITTVFPSPTRVEIPVVKEYRANLAKYGPKDAQPSIVSLEGYIAAKVIVEAVKRAGANVTRENVMHSLESLSKTEIGGYRVDFGSKSRMGSTYVDMSIINKNGAVIR